MTGSPLTLYNSLTRSLEPFVPIDPSNVRVYTCGPTVYNYQHIGNMRAFLFADTLGRVLRWKGYPTKHIINITDVGHLTSDADAGDDKMEKAAAAQAKSIWEIAAHYTEAFKQDVARLNITTTTEWTVATDHIPQMIDFAKKIEADCYEIEGGLYFDTSKVPHYGALARAATDEGESRIDPVSGKRHPQDFAIWRKSPPGEQRQMEWDSPWGRGAPGWHLECSVMSLQHLGHPFDIHTGGIDHREIHHPNEIAQNQAFCGCEDSGARIWMHNNFLVDRGGKMSKSAGEFLRLQTLIDAGFHPLAYRLMCLQAHYRSELEFSWDNLAAASVRLKRLVIAIGLLRNRAEPDATETSPLVDEQVRLFDASVSDDLNTARALTHLEILSAAKMNASARSRLAAIMKIDEVLGLDLLTLTRADLRVRPASATLTETNIETHLAARKEARAAKDFARSDAIRDQLTAAGVEVMDGDPLGWDWKIDV
ncbi:MAG: cysteine--tRNA ligase [Sphingomonas sp. 28-62-20]|uniref:cysteine--tRNA ligase n=1 Tax=Sphingomonas sp. 28-62-20 TaxID=1970433 RepID=UPI000BCEEBDA|nr:MAG: cysteine--tRNA ligase [Sphingomonas sp. 28-62-20]